MRTVSPLVLFAASIALAQPPRPADELLTAAKSQANGRAIFAIFHASW